MILVNHTLPLASENKFSEKWEFRFSHVGKCPHFLFNISISTDNIRFFEISTLYFCFINRAFNILKHACKFFKLNLNSLTLNCKSLTLYLKLFTLSFKSITLYLNSSTLSCKLLTLYLNSFKLSYELLKLSLKSSTLSCKFLTLSFIQLKKALIQTLTAYPNFHLYLKSIIYLHNSNKTQGAFNILINPVAWVLNANNQINIIITG